LSAARAIRSAIDACAAAPSRVDGFEQLASIYADAGAAVRLAAVVDAMRNAPTHNLLGPFSRAWTTEAVLAVRSRPP
jgi:hypothetical protein